MTEIKYTEIMQFNKMIIFLENLISEDINYKIFIEKINFDLNFIHEKICEIWEVIFKYNSDEGELNNKSLYFLLKKFSRVLNKIKDNNKIYDIDNFDRSNFNFISDDISEKIYLLNKKEILIKLKNTEKQFINEEEYNMLLDLYNKEIN